MRAFRARSGRSEPALLLVLLVGAFAIGSDVARPEASQSQPGNATTLPAMSTPALPQPPDGVTHLNFTELFEKPGARGSEYTPLAKKLAGKRVRMVGFMVREAHKGSHHGHHHENHSTTKPDQRGFMIASLPIVINDAEFGLADDLPLSTVFVRLARSDTQDAEFAPGPIVVTGILGIGHAEEPDGRVSWVRLALDAPFNQRPSHATSTSAPSESEHDHADHRHTESMAEKQLPTPNSSK